MSPLQITLMLIGIAVSGTAAIFAFLNLRAGRRRDERERLAREHKLHEIEHQLKEMAEHRDAELARELYSYEETLKAVNRGNAGDVIHVQGMGEMSHTDYYTFKVKLIRQQHEDASRALKVEREFVRKQLENH